ncbi:MULTISPECIES: heavy metal translocating P-type ATPase [unclassified Sphingomonas]|uniref:heavy metal translocating P-type ATPase n=1 Tax=unclassified Sphingomonas TaxID=196159 RepID=UPI0006F5C562|nr:MULTISPECIES: heavy metal translocating P-type ATPase [unclassified Sphingomonas]KQX23278.1 nitrogen fixation protein FixI [Sphingomonas sp. Root1294]KQY68126.1 nitrogen fixation protein FixI [Sphingomonas sp. Root50]KRB91018.1 nitrogen fixation protein FixI [Sphingomonas sp. Root720]
MTAIVEHSEFSLPGVRCAACIAKIERGLMHVPGVLGARVNLAAKRVAIDHEAAVDLPSLRAALDSLGFVAEPVLFQDTDLASRKESRQLLKALGVAGFAAMNIMLFSVSIWSGADGATRQLFHWLSALIAMPAIAYAGRPFFRSAWAALRRGRTNMDVPISIGVLLATTLSLFETITGGAHAYFDGAVSLIFFLLAGRFLDSAMRDRARDGAGALLRQTAPGGTIVWGDGKTEWRTADGISPGMALLVSAGERFAADGTIEEGVSAVDRSLVTGESRPEPVGKGAAVIAGSLNLSGPVTVRVTATGPDTAIAGIVRLVEAAGQGRSRYVRIADRAARYYAPAVHTLAALAFVGWMIAGAGWHASLLIAIAVLIVTCPCALGLAVPVAQVVASGAMMRRGLLVKDGSALERLAEADRVCFDKTGTLTLGRPELVGAEGLDGAERSAALALARASTHPLSRSLARTFDAQGVRPAGVTDLREVPGMGMEARVGGVHVRLGRPGWIGVSSAGNRMLSCAFAIEGRKPHLLLFADKLRPDAEAAVARVARMAMDPIILSGDRREAVAAIAAAVHVPAMVGMTPGQKLEAVQRLTAAGHRVLMVGDGLNDGPALAAGHVSIAPSSASDVGQNAADIVFLGDSLLPVPIAVAAAHRTMRVVRQNFALAIGYNILAVPLALLGLVTPLIAAIAMSTSSIIVVANALRLTRCAR